MAFKMAGFSAFTKTGDKSKLHANLSDEDKRRIYLEAHKKAEDADDAQSHYRTSGDFSENPNDKNVKSKMKQLENEAIRLNKIAKNLAKKYNIKTNIIKK